MIFGFTELVSPHPLMGTISSPCWIQWQLEPQMMTNVPPRGSKINVFALILTSKFGHVANKGQREHMHVNSKILDVWMQLLQILVIIL